MSAPEMESETPKRTRKTTDQQPQGDNGNLPDATQVLEAVRTEVLHQVEIRPYTTILVAAGVGYIIGAGAPRWVSGIAWTLGSRAVMARVLGAL
ncbi:MAG: hypothetical protein H0V89_03135 [Deltaproteobacteria bacterium]|nr:hypothetical protein [Deltaproteobacteria bacterium]